MMNTSEPGENQPPKSSQGGGQHSRAHKKQFENQQKNLRRRVYDSLNVLYAVGVLKKGKNKQVFCSQEYDMRHKLQQQEQQVVAFERDNFEKIKDLEAKKHKLAELAKQQMAFQYMIKRNRKYEEKINTRKIRQAPTSTSVVTDHQQPPVPQTAQTETALRIKLPFLLANVPNRPDNELKLLEFNQQRLELVSNMPIHCYGDLDVLEMMGFGEVYSARDFKEFLGQEFE
jgi:hypothetical protein